MVCWRRSVCLLSDPRGSWCSWRLGGLAVQTLGAGSGRAQLRRQHFRGHVVMRGVPAHGPTLDEDGLWRLVQDTEVCGNLARERALPDDIHQIDRDLRMFLHESLHLDEGIRGGRSGRAVLEHHQQVP